MVVTIWQLDSTLKKDNLKNFRNFLLKDFLKSGASTDHIYSYDSEISSIAFNKNFFNDINLIGIGNRCSNNIFLFRDLKIIKKNILNNKININLKLGFQ